MTLVAGFLDHGCPVLFGDLITSVPANLGTKTLTNLPLAGRLDLNVAVEGGYKLFGLTQKVVIVSDRLCVAWTGPAWRADALLRRLREVEQRNPTGSLIEFFHSYPRESYGDLEMVAYVYEPGGFRWFTSPEMVKMEYGPFNLLCVGGSGRPALLSAIDSVEVRNFGEPSEANPYNYNVGYALALLGQLLTKQSRSGFGLDQGWGGGFEVAYYDHERRRFAKVDRIIQLHWEVVEVSPGDFSLALLDPFVFQWTMGEETMFWVGDPGAPTNIHVVGPPWLRSAPFPIPMPPPPMTFMPDFTLNLYQRRDLDGSGGFGCMMKSARGLLQISTGPTKTNITLGNSIAVEMAEAVGQRITSYKCFAADLPWPPEGNFEIKEA